MKILCIIDRKLWAFHRNCLALQKFGQFEYNIRFGQNDKYRNVLEGSNKFDLILYWTDVRPDHIVKRNFPKSKTVVMIRSDIWKTCKPSRLAYWKEADLMKKHIKCFMVSNKYLLKRFREKFKIKCYYAPGGVDTSLFKPPTERKWFTTPRVGWAGSKKNYGTELRGIGLIRQACKELGWPFRPAYREKRWRTHKEMVNYYHNEIDLYIDLWVGAGRQNGLLEAGACGVPLVSCEKGIASELSSHGLVLANRSIQSVKAALKRAYINKEQYSKTISQHIAEEWSWKDHVAKWEEIFKNIEGSSRGR